MGIYSLYFVIAMILAPLALLNLLAAELGWTLGDKVPTHMTGIGMATLAVAFSAVVVGAAALRWLEAERLKDLRMRAE